MIKFRCVRVDREKRGGGAGGRGEQSSEVLFSLLFTSFASRHTWRAQSCPASSYYGIFCPF